MFDVLGDVGVWWGQRRSVGVATVISTSSSAPRSPGASMLVGPSGAVIGSVSGGCVEGAVDDVATEVIADGNPRLERYGVSDSNIFAIGLTCGGTIEVFVQRLDPSSFPDLHALSRDVSAGRAVALATVVEHPRVELIGRQIVVWPDEHRGTLGIEGLDNVVIQDARGLLISGRSTTLSYGPEGERQSVGTRVFVESQASVPRMLIFGAIDHAAALARIGSLLGYQVTVCDARAVFATTARFPAADEVVVDWPHRYLATEEAAGRLDARTVVCVLTHDEKFDLPLLEVALRLPKLAYVGAMGSRRTVADRLERLSAAGLGPAERSRLSAPIGLDLGARTPEETAISIAAEIIASRNGSSAGRLANGKGPIHAWPSEV